MNKAIIIFSLLIFSVQVCFSQNELKGTVIDAKSGKPLQGVNINIPNSNIGTVTGEDGKYSITNIPIGDYSVKATYVGYASKTKKIRFKKNSVVNWDIQMEYSASLMDEIVITATKSEQRISKVPNKVHSLSAESIEAIPVHTIDDVFKMASGVNIDRPHGIFSSKAIVTMRGLSGNEQGRTLVLLDGIPINKSDGGTVNFHLVEGMGIKKVEILKGPASALYGGNAMGGVINIISSKPKKTFEPYAYAKYGTYNTMETGAMTRGRTEMGFNYFYWGINGHYTKSDGYITEPPIEQTEYTVESFLEEKNLGTMFGYSIKDNHNIELQLQMYDDERGSGEKVIEDLGSYNQHDSYHSRLNYFGKTGKTKLKSSLFFLQENYKKVNEYMKGSQYTLYDVDSRRRDVGFLFHATKRYFKNHEITAGFDIKQGSVVAADIYYTSTDKINNQGFMNFGAAFIQDAIDITNKFRVIAGLRYDYAAFFNGEFTVENPSAKVEYMQQYEDENLDEHQWNAITGKLSAQYNLNSNMKLYASYGQGFRPPILDDMCRSGKTRGGFQVANPGLKPETLDNIEFGSDILLMNKMQVSPAAYYSIGRDFMYFVSTGDTVDMGYPAAVLHSENVSKVEIYGFELDFDYHISSQIRFFGNYAYSHSKIVDYTPSIEQMTDIEGNFLVKVPGHLGFAGLTWKNSIINTSVSARYTGESYRRDDNLEDEKYGVPATYPSVTTFDAKVWKTIFDHYTMGVSVQNVFNDIYTDRKGELSPGRFIMGEISVKL